MNLQPFGRECYVHIPSAKRPAGSKLLQRAEKGLFVGYTKVPQQYRIYMPEKRKICVSAEIVFNPFPASQLNAGPTLPSSFPPPITETKTPRVTTQQRLLHGGMAWEKIIIQIYLTYQTHDVSLRYLHSSRMK
ncbi:hypothetical protein K3495_g3098 [Podosphaera aphanis]|nr:hypothetical protein K3495_g3098 [Podosphaera aphanis]